MPGSLWYTVPVALNALSLLIDFFTGRLTVDPIGTRHLYFSIPYWLMVLVVARRCHQPGTIVDLLFFWFGLWSIILGMEAAFLRLVLLRAQPGSILHGW